MDSYVCVLETCRPFDIIEPLRKEAALSIRMPKCGVCGADVKEQPKITEKGACSVCGAKLTFKK